MTEASPSEQLSDRAFGVENRARLLRQYFESETAGTVTAASAWQHCYRLLLWIDRTTGLAHCYESDKCQPGRPWYERSLRFHSWLSEALGVAPKDLGTHLDYMFLAATADLARVTDSRRPQLALKASSQHEAFPDLPFPGDDPELDQLIIETLRTEAGVEIDAVASGTLRRQIQALLGGENKRKNLLGEGFEDTLGELLRRDLDVSRLYKISVRPSLHDLPGFFPPRGTDKTRQVDLALTNEDPLRRVLVTCKWSVRSDREEQFATDFEAYSRLEALGQDFDYVLLTNEFDPARLAAACEARRQNGSLFTAVVHVNPAGLRAAYGTQQTRTSKTGGMARAVSHIESGRLISLETWLTQLQHADIT